MGGGLLVLAPLALVFYGHLDVGAFSASSSIVLACAALALAAVTSACWREVGDILGSRSLWIAAALFAVPLAVALIQTLTPGFDREYALMGLLRLLAVGALFVVGCAIGFEEGRLKLFRIGFCVCAVIFALGSLIGFQLVSTHAIIVGPFVPDDRLTSTFFTPNTAALDFSICLMATLAVALVEFQDRRAPGAAPREARGRLSLLGWLAAAAAVLSLIALGLTRSRSGVFVTMAALGVGFLIFAARSRRMLLFAGPPVVLFGLAIMAAAIFTRLGSANDDLALRSQIYRAHLPSALDQPLLGHGFGSFTAVNKTLISEDNFAALFNIGAMHDLYLQWTEQAGWIATVAMAGCIVWIMVKLAGQAGVGRRASVYWIRAALIVLAMSFLQGLLDLALEHYSIVLLLTLMTGTAFGLCLRRDAREAAQSSGGRSAGAVGRSRRQSEAELSESAA